MKPLVRLLPGLAGLLVAVLQADSEADLHQSFTVKPGGTLVVAASRGSIELVTGTDDKLDVQVQRRVVRASASRAQEWLDSHRVTFTQDGNRVTVRDRLPSSLGSGWRRGDLQVRYVITLPGRFDLDLKTAGGSIRVPDHAGTVTLATSGGSLDLGAQDGTVKARTAGGGIRVKAATGAVDAETSGGSIEVGEAKGPASLGTSGGSIRVRQALGALTARTSGGSIEVTEAQAAVRATTSGGSITTAFASVPADGCHLATSGGSVRVRVPAGAHATVDAQTSGGRVTCDLPVTIQGKRREAELKGTLGEGGPLLHLRTSGGSISLGAR